MSIEVTIVHVPRERYGETRASLDSILRNTEGVPYKLLILDAASPPAVAEHLRAVAAEGENRELLRFDFIMTPNELRNEAIKRLDTPYVAFVDNDAHVAPGWLPPLLRAAKEKDAWVVAPVMLIGELDTGTIHIAGGDCAIVEEDGERRYSYLQQHFVGRELPEVRDQLEAGPCTLLEFHVMLVAKKAFDRLGPLDERLMSFCECDSFSMDVHEAGGLIWFEPESVATYVPPRRAVSREDMEYVVLRWSDEWNRRSLDAFTEARKISHADPWLAHAESWPKIHRRYGLKYVMWPLGRIAELIQYKVWFGLGDWLGSRVEALFTRRVRRARAQGLKARSAE